MDWPLHRLEDLTEPDRPITYGVVKPGPEDLETGVKFIRGGDIFEGKLAIESLRTITPEISKSYSRTLLSGGELVISLVGNPGHVAVVPKSLAGANLARQAGLIALRDGIDADFIKFYLMSPQGRAELFAQMTGSVQIVINLHSLRTVRVPLPPLPVQQHIAGILSAYDELIENSQRRIKILESMARSLYREWFVHFRFPGHDQPAAPVGTAEGCPEGVSARQGANQNHPHVASPLGEIPQGWGAIPFERLLASMTGGDWGSEQPEDRDTAEVMVVRGTDFDEVAYGRQLRAPVRYIKPSSLVSRGLKAGDVIIENSINAKSRSVGTTLLVDNHVLNRLGHDAIAASFCKVFRPHDHRIAPLVHLHARHLREDARMEYYQNVAANGIANFQAQKFAKEEQLILPTDEAMRAKLIEPIASIFQSVGVLASKLSNLRRTRDLLLPRLLSGQVAVDAHFEAISDLPAGLPQ